MGTASPSGRVRPFDVDRDGTGFCEGAGVVVLEDLEACRARGRRPLALLAGYGMGTDTNSLTAPAEDGAGAVAAMRAALGDAGLTPAAIDLVQAHGTGTRMNDEIEARAIAEVFGAHLPEVAISADKGAIGHTLGASGALSAILVLCMMREKLIPPVTGCETADTACAIPLVTHGPIRRRIRAALCNNFGFGGANLALVLERHV